MLLTSPCSTTWTLASVSFSSSTDQVKTGDGKDDNNMASPLTMAPDDNNNNDNKGTSSSAPTEEALHSYLHGTPYGKLCGTSSPDIVKDLLD